MKRLGHNLLTATALASLILVGGPGWAQEPDAYGDDYQSGDYGRVRYQENDLSILRADTNLEEQADINSPIYPGDSLSTVYGQRAEIQLAGGTLVRIDRDSQLTFLALPNPYADIQDNTILQLEDGVIRLSAQLSENEEFRIDTPAASIYLVADGDYRIEVDRNGRTSAISRSGVAEVVGSGGSVLLRAGMRVDTFPGAVPLDPEPFNTFISDSFDRWVDRRDASYRVRDSYAEADGAYDSLPGEVRPYYGELSRSGRWAYVDDYGYVWYPNDRPVGWRPYHYGRWSYGSRGYFWVSSENWGWAPYHYGRWNWAAGYGWVWCPGRVFSGAWVAWSWGSAYVGWCPLDYWNRPAYISTIHYGYYDPYAWSLIGYNNFHHRWYNNYYVTVNHIGDNLIGSAVVTRPPRVSPTKLSKTPEARSLAVRKAREDRSVAIAKVVQERRPARTFVDQDARLAQKLPAAATRPLAARPADRGPKLTGGTPSGATRGAKSVRSTDKRPTATPATPRYPRAGSTERVPTANRSGSNKGTDRRGATSKDTRSTRPPVRRTVPSTSRRPSSSKAEPQRVESKERPRGTKPAEVRPSSAAPKPTTNRREIYRRMASPRTPKKQPESTRKSTTRTAPSSVRPRPSSSSGRKPTARPAPSRSAPRASSRPSSPPKRPSASPSRSSRPKASPSRPKSSPGKSSGKSGNKSRSGKKK